MKGETFIIKKFYADTVVGREGVCIKTWKTPNGQEWVKLDFGKNQSGQKLQKAFPADVLKKKAKKGRKTGLKQV